MAAWEKLMELNSKARLKDGSRLSGSILSQERDNIERKAREGYATTTEIFLLLRGKPVRQSVSYAEVELVLKRLAITLTEHRCAEILSGAKLMIAQKSHGLTKITFSHVEEIELEKIEGYLENLTIEKARSDLDLSVKSLLNYSLAMFFIFLFACLVVSNLTVYYFQGEYLGSVACFSIPILSLVIFRHRNATRDVPQHEKKAQMDSSFELVTNSKAEIVI